MLTYHYLLTELGKDSYLNFSKENLLALVLQLYYPYLSKMIHLKFFLPLSRDSFHFEVLIN